MKIQHWLAAAAAVALATTVVGCSGNGGSGDGGEVTLEMVESLTSPTRTELLKNLIAGFEEANPGIKVNLVSPPTEQADSKIQQMLQAGSGIDVLEVRDNTVGAFSTNGWLYDMAADSKAWSGWDDLTEAAQTASFTGDTQYLIPYGFYGLSLFYRTDLIEEAGFSGPPHSWQDLYDQAKAIQNPSQNRYGYAFRGGKNANGQLAAVLEAFAADKLDTANAFKTTAGGTLFGTPEALEGLKFYISLYEDASPEAAIAWGYPEMVEGFNNGSTAFLLQDPEVIATISESETVTESQWNTAPLPVGPSGKAFQPMAWAGWGVAKSSQHTAEAVKLVQYLTSDGAIEFAKGNSMVPILASAADDEYFKTGPWASYVKMTNEPETYLPVTEPRTVSWWSEWQAKADADFQKVLLGQATPEDTLADWDAYWTEKFASQG
jgi:multiple sugar transport system substrate-binding protein